MYSSGRRKIIPDVSSKHSKEQRAKKVANTQISLNEYCLYQATVKASYLKGHKI